MKESRLKFTHTMVPINTLVMLTANTKDGEPVITTIGAPGFASRNPPSLTLPLKPKSLIYKCVEETGEACVNYPSMDLMWEVDFCGRSTFKRTRMFQLTGLTPEKGEVVKAPMIKECPVNIECVVRQKVLIGKAGDNEDLFICEVVAQNVLKDAISPSGKLDLAKARLLTSNGMAYEYWSLGSKLADDGFSVDTPRARSLGNVKLLDLKYWK